MVLSDKSITDLCIRPQHFFDKTLYDIMLGSLKNRLGEEALRMASRGQTVSSSGMTICSDHYRQVCSRPWTEDELSAWRPMIEPFSPKQVRTLSDDIDAPRIISRGLTSYGYDVMLDRTFKIFTNVYSGIIDPKKLDPKCLVDLPIEVDEDTGQEYVVMPPNSYLLGHTGEYFCIPRDVVVICVGKSTYARAGILVNVTPIEPGFEGTVVIEISNATNSPARIYVGEGISQFLFLQGDRPCEVSYGDRGGKYQGQLGLTLPRV